MSTLFNNYDTSSSGIDIELRVCMDTCEAREIFDNDVHVISSDRYGATLAIYEPCYTPADVELRNWTELYDFANVTEKDYRQWFADVYIKEDRYVPWTFRDVVADKMNYHCETWKEFFHDQIAIDDFYNWRDVECEEVEVPNNATLLYDYYHVTGYSQGEACTVLVKNEDPDWKPNVDTIEKVFYATPLWAWISVDGEEYDISAELEDPYDYDKDDIMGVMDHLLSDDPETAAKVKTFLESNLPEYPDYI